MNPVVQYVIGSLGWSLLGFLAGFLVASMRRDVSDIKEAVVPDEHHEQEHHRPTASTATRWLGVIVVLLAVVSVIQGLVVQRRIADVTECQADFNARFARALTLRAELGEEDRLALQNMLLALYEQREQSEKQRLETFENWVETVRENNKERAEHPLPEVPKGDCR